MQIWKVVKDALLSSGKIPERNEIFLRSPTYNFEGKNTMLLSLSKISNRKLSIRIVFFCFNKPSQKKKKKKKNTSRYVHLVLHVFINGSMRRKTSQNQLFLNESNDAFISRVNNYLAKYEQNISKHDAFLDSFP